MDSNSITWATSLKQKLEALTLGIGIVYYPHSYMTSSRNVFDTNIKFFLNELGLYFHHTSIGVDYLNHDFFDIIKKMSDTNDLTIVTGFENSPLLSPEVLKDTFRMELLYELRDNTKMFGLPHTSAFRNEEELLNFHFLDEYGIDFTIFLQFIDNYSFFKHSVIEQKELLFSKLHPAFHPQAHRLGATITLNELNKHPWTKLNPTLLILPDYLLGFMIALDPANGLYSLANSQLGVQGFDANYHFIDSYIPSKGLRYPTPNIVYNQFSSLLDEFSA
jgi:hypothetical protein